MGFTAMAAETGFPEGAQVDDYVQGGIANGTNVSRSFFQWGFPETCQENLELINWMRSYNARPPTTRKIRFYGIDLAGGRQGNWRESRQTLDSALEYLRSVDAPHEQQFRERLSPYLVKFNQDSYPTLNRAERDALTGTIADLVSIFERRRFDFLAMTTKPEYQRAYRHAIVARQTDSLFRVGLPFGQDGEARRKAMDEDGAMVRETAMAENLLWALDREGSRGRLLVYEHNFHLKKGRQGGTLMGEYLHATLDSEMVVFGAVCRRGDEQAKFPSTASSVEGICSHVGPSVFALDLRAAPKVGLVADWLKQDRNFRANDFHFPIKLLEAFDVLLFVDKTTGLHLIR